VSVRPCGLGGSMLLLAVAAAALLELALPVVDHVQQTRHALPLSTVLYLLNLRSAMVNNLLSGTLQQYPICACMIHTRTAA
jgi:hypothetical protein